MCEQCVPASLSSSPTREPGNEAMIDLIYLIILGLHHSLPDGICLLAAVCTGVWKGV